jgi:hypothetical protein
MAFLHKWYRSRSENKRSTLATGSQQERNNSLWLAVGLRYFRFQGEPFM